jgi:hypothetical protein
MEEGFKAELPCQKTRSCTGFFYGCHWRIIKRQLQQQFSNALVLAFMP